MKAEMTANTESTTLCCELINALEVFDQSNSPYGLFAIDDFAAKTYHLKKHKAYPEWHFCLKPYLEKNGYVIGFEHNLRGVFEFAFSASPHIDKAIQLQIAKISKVKVRKYGSHYRVDNLEKYTERWSALSLDKQLSNLWRPSSLANQNIGLRIVLFIGFDKSQEPFTKELVELRKKVDWSKHDVDFLSRTSEDRYERKFNLRLCVWSKPSS